MNALLDLLLRDDIGVEVTCYITRLYYIDGEWIVKRRRSILYRGESLQAACEAFAQSVAEMAR